MGEIDRFFRVKSQRIIINHIMRIYTMYKKKFKDLKRNLYGSKI